METVKALIPERALDLGCRADGNTIALAERGVYVPGIDFAEQAVDLAKGRADGGYGRDTTVRER